MGTKIKILHTSKKEFNSKGISSLSLRDLANEVGISHGNLCYHYANKDDIIKALYFEMSEKVEQLLNPNNPSDNFGVEILERLFDLYYEYRFILKNITEIFNRNADLKKIYIQNTKKRENELLAIMSLLSKQGFLKKGIDGDEKRMIIDKVNLIAYTWIPYAELINFGTKKQSRQYFIKLQFTTIEPYLSRKAKKFVKSFIDF